jgi:hypothetical protein
MYTVFLMQNARSGFFPSVKADIKMEISKSLNSQASETKDNILF